MSTNIWDERYGEAEFAYGTKPNDFLASLELRPEGKQRVLCLAEGEGRNGVYLAKLGFEVLAVDQSTVGLQKALLLAKENDVKVEVEQADLSSYRIPANSLDGVVSIYGHFDATTRRHIHREALQALKPGGFLVIEAYSKEQLGFNTGGPRDEKLLYELADLEADFAGDINFIIKSKTERNVVEGKYHTGRGSVIQIFGRKQ